MCRVNPLCKAKRCDCASFEAKLSNDGLGHLDTKHWLEVPEEGLAGPAIGVSNRGSGKVTLRHPLDAPTHQLEHRGETEELLDEAGDILRSHQFASSLERDVWRIYARGDGMKGAARELEISFRQARRIVLEVTRRWRERQRRPLRLTPGVVRRADPAFLLKLLEAL